jgi:hypothetical protein
MAIDEFEIIARASDRTERRWTRSNIDAARSLAEQAVDKHGYVYAQVVNVFGGHRSDPLHVVVVVDPDEEPPTVRMPRPKRTAA